MSWAAFLCVGLPRWRDRCHAAMKQWLAWLDIVHQDAAATTRACAADLGAFATHR